MPRKRHSTEQIIAKLCEADVQLAKGHGPPTARLPPERTAFVWHGLAWQQELHWKQIEDRRNGTTTTLMGNYAQLGYFFHGLWTWFPRPLELAVRHAIYDPNRDVVDDLQQEFTLASNWFFSGHLNKLTAEWSYFDFQNLPEDQEAGHRFRLHWDVSF